jgi:prepilin-type N-terminal cleavage/methylation domain-containing protein
MTTRGGLTLLELVVVLAILATLTTVATIAVLPSVDATRYEATRQTLAEVRDAAEGRVFGSSVSGFAGDVGRLPTTLADLTSTTLPAGLTPWVPTRTFPLTLSLVSGTATLAGGWRGPYLRLGLGQSTILDGWGDPFSVSGGGENDWVVSTTAHDAPYDTAMSQTLSQPISITVGFTIDAPARVIALAVLGPDPENAGALRVVASSADPRADTTTTSESMNNALGFGIGPGLRAVVLAIDRDGDAIAEPPLLQRDVIIPPPPAITVIDLGKVY